MYSTFRKLAKNERVDKAQFDSVMKYVATIMIFTLHAM